jgi:hypothetical protein
MADHDTLGQNVAGYPLAMSISDGVGFRMPDGGTLLERRRLHPTEGPWQIVGFKSFAELLGIDESQVESKDSHPHDADQSYHYRARHVNGNGYVDDEPGPIVRLDFDSGGSRIAAGLPHRPLHLTVTPIISGAFDLFVYLDDTMPGAVPIRIEAFSGTPTVDYDDPLVDADSGGDLNPWKAVDSARRIQRFRTVAYVAGTAVVFAVRALSTATASELNEYESEAVFPLDSGPSGFDYAMSISSGSDGLGRIGLPRT